MIACRHPEGGRDYAQHAAATRCSIQGKGSLGSVERGEDPCPDFQ